MSKFGFQRSLNIAAYAFFFEADGVGHSGRKHMGNDMRFWADLFLYVLGCFFPNHCLAIQLISTLLCLGVLAVELDSAILSQNAGMLGLFSDILEPQVRTSPFSDILHPFCSIFSKL